jgi:H+/Cl- antiporter ClcA
VNDFGTSMAPEDVANPLDLLRSRAYLAVLALGAMVGVPVAVVAFGFLKLVNTAQEWLFSGLPGGLGFDAAPIWWPVPLLVVAGLLVGASIRYLPGTAGHEPTGGLSATGAPLPIELPGVAVAAFVTLTFGVVLGPEAPLIAIGGGLAALAVRFVRRDAPNEAVLVIGAAGSFAAVSTLLGSPIVGAFLLMEVAGLAGPLIGVVLAPGLLAAGIGSLVFIGLNGLTGWGTFSLAVPDIPPFTQVDVSHFLWAIVIGLLAAVVGTTIKAAAVRLQPVVAAQPVARSAIVGAGIGLCAVAFAALTDRDADSVLFSGESALTPLIQQAGAWSVGALVLLLLCKSVAYALSLSAFRGGPTFPAMFIGAAGGIALSHLPGLPPIAGVAMGIGAMAVTMLRLPLTSVLLTVLFLAADAVTLMPLVIVAVVVAYVASVRLGPPAETPPAETSPPA